MSEEKNKDDVVSTGKTESEEAKTAPQFIGLNKTETKPAGEKSEESTLRDLIEKNLKWSQIIYEQNRRISRRLLFSSIMTWVKWIIIAAAIIWGTWTAWPIVTNLLSQYGAITSGINEPGKKLDPATLDKILKMIPLSDAEKEQIKAMNK